MEVFRSGTQTRTSHVDVRQAIGQKRKAVSTHVQEISKRRTWQSRDNQQQRETNLHLVSTTNGVLQGRVNLAVGYGAALGDFVLHDLLDLP